MSRCPGPCPGHRDNLSDVPGAGQDVPGHQTSHRDTLSGTSGTCPGTTCPGCPGPGGTCPGTSGTCCPGHRDTWRDSCPGTAGTCPGWRPGHPGQVVPDLSRDSHRLRCRCPEVRAPARSLTPAALAVLPRDERSPGVDHPPGLLTVHWTMRLSSEGFGECLYRSEAHWTVRNRPVDDHGQ